jgi:hypothetical protein
MLERRVKSHKRYIFYRIYAPTVWVIGLIWGIFWIITAVNNQQPSTIQIVVFALLFPCFGIDVFMILSLFVFPFDYSIFGRFERTPFPDEEPVLKKTKSWGQIGLFRATIPFFNWYVYPSGLGISILGIGKVVIPAESITEFNRKGGLGFWGTPYEVLHKCQELHDPIYLPNSELFEQLQTIVQGESVTSESQRKEKSSIVNFLLIIAILWGIPMMLFSFGTTYQRLDIEVEDEVISREVGRYPSGPHRWYADYNIRQDDGTIISYRAGNNDPSLSRDIPIRAYLIKKKWSLNYYVDGKEVDDFPRVFYPIIGTIGFLIFSVSLIATIRRLTKN